MGRRKIEIQPITDERNRTVTFIKRKAGLFKKAHELAVLCQVDITLLILGSNNTFYEFSSVESNDLIDNYQNNDNFNHDLKDPSDFGPFKKKKFINLSRNNRNRSNNHNHDNIDSGISLKPFKNNHTNTNNRNNNNNTTLTDYTTDDDDDNDNEEEEDPIEENEFDNGKNSKKNNKLLMKNANNLIKRSRSIINNTSNNNNKANKKIKFDNDNNSNINITNNDDLHSSNNFLQQRVQRQFKVLENDSLNNTNSTNSTTTSNIKSDSSTVLPSLNRHSSGENSIKSDNNYNAHKRNSSRPVLRVQIPNNNIISTTTIKSEPSSANPSVYGNTSPHHYKKLSYELNSNNTTISPKNGTPTSVTGTAGPLTIERNENGKMALRIPNSSNTFSFSNGLPPLSAMPPYIATPLQSAGMNHNSLSNNTNSNTTTNNNSINIRSNNNNNPNITSPTISGKPYSVLQQQSSQRYLGRSSSPIMAHHSSDNNDDNMDTNDENMHTNTNTTLHNDNNSNNNNNITNTSSNSEHNNQNMVNGPPTGSLPSKYLNDLMIPSPSVQMSMFQEWGFGINNASATSRFAPLNQLSSNNVGANNNSIQNVNTYNPSNGNTGLTPYIGTGQTPIGNRFFNFSTDITSPDQTNSHHGSNNSNSNMTTSPKKK